MHKAAAGRNMRLAGKDYHGNLRRSRCNRYYSFTVLRLLPGEQGLPQGQPTISE